MIIEIHEKDIRCDHCNICFAQGDRVISWRLALGEICFHYGCAQAFSKLFFTHLRSVQKEVDRDGYLTLTPSRNKTSTQYRPEFVTRQTGR